MSTTMANPASVPSAPVPPVAAATEIPALPTVPDPVSRLKDSPVAQAEPSVEAIRIEAYRLYVDRGSEDGHDVEDWLTAEALVRARVR